MSRKRLEMKLDPEEDKILVPSSSEDEEEDLSEDEDDFKKIPDPFAEEEGESDEDDSDAAPEAISFQSALESTKLQNQQRTAVIRTHAEDRRKKRKEIHEQYLLQKQEKRQKIEANMLPADFLENLSEKASKTSDANTPVEVKEGSVAVRNPAYDELVSVHGHTTFKCKILSEEAKKPKYIPEKAASFKDQLLYNSRIKREKSACDAAKKVVKQTSRFPAKFKK